MRLNTDPRLPIVTEDSQYLKDLNWRLTQLLRDYANQVNSVSEGFVKGTTNATTAAPTTGTYSQGDFIRNSAPSELGTAGSKYIIKGWVCTVSGTPGTWVQERCLTGN